MQLVAEVIFTKAKAVDFLTHSLPHPPKDEIIQAWLFIAETVFVPYTEQEYERLVELLDSLIDRVGEDETHSLASMMDVIGVLIENYEAEHIPELEVS